MAPVIPRIFQGLVDDAAVFPPGNASLEDALVNHHRYRGSWYSPFVGPLLVPASRLGRIPELTDNPPPIGIIVDIDPAELKIPADLIITHCEVKTPTVTSIREIARRGIQEGFEQPVMIELPWGPDQEELLNAAADAELTPKFRTGGVDAAAFPTEEALAAALWGAMDRDLGFKLTAGLHHAVRHTDPETGFEHHGFLNVLAVTMADSHEEVLDVLRMRDGEELARAVRLHMSQPRQHWVAFGSCSIGEPLQDLIALSLVEEI